MFLCQKKTKPKQMVTGINHRRTMRGFELRGRPRFFNRENLDFPLNANTLITLTDQNDISILLYPGLDHLLMENFPL